MAQLVVTAANVNIARQPIDGTIIRPYLCGAALITPGQAVSIDVNGLAQIADATVVANQQVRGIALQRSMAGQAIDVVEKGVLEGFTITQAFDALIFLDTAGNLADVANGTKTIRCGRVVPATTRDSSGNVKKLLFFQSDMLNNW